MEFRLNSKQITLEELNEFKELLKIKKLPLLYEEVILKYNGGIPEKEYFRGNTVYFESIKYDEYPLENVIRVLDEVLPKGAFPFADYCGQSLCISLNEEDYGAIYFFDETGDYDKVCDSFEQFMEELSEDDDY